MKYQASTEGQVGEALWWVVWIWQASGRFVRMAWTKYTGLLKKDEADPAVTVTGNIRAAMTVFRHSCLLIPKIYVPFLYDVDSLLYITGLAVNKPLSFALLTMIPHSNIDTIRSARVETCYIV